MKKTMLIFLLLAVISTMLIAGCTQVQTLPAPAPAVTAVPTYVENQQGVAIIRTVNVTATPTVAVTVNPTVEVKIAQNVVVVPNQTVSNVTNKT
jgi:outer membrane lipoprotein-sorting protein